MLDFNFMGAKPQTPTLGRCLAYNTNTVKTTFSSDSSSVTATVPTQTQKNVWQRHNLNFKVTPIVNRANRHCKSCSL